MKLQRSEPEIDTLVSRIRNGELDLQPEFQRGEIWDRKRQQRLIDTVLRNWYVPAVHIVETHDGEVVLDGQQRLAAIRDFYDDKFPVDGKVEPLNETVLELHGKKYSQLDPSIQRAIGRFVVPMVRLSDYDPAEPNELFFRLNQSYNLTPPEKRNALHGIARDEVKHLVRELEGSGLLTLESVGFNNNRLAYDDIVSRACVTLELGTLAKHINNNVVENFYRQRRGFSEEVLGAVADGGQTLLDQIRNARHRIKFNKGTLQTWLIYCAWAPIQSGPVPPMLLSEFEAARVALRRGADLFSRDMPNVARTLLELYDDRASYRVTDVSSVRIRDLAIHLVSHIFFGTPVDPHTSGLIEELAASHRSPQQLVADYIERVDWGGRLLGGGSR